MARLPTIAIATASTAVALSLIALLVVATRRPPKIQDPGAVAFETAVAASDVMKLRSTGLEPVKEDGGVIGVRALDVNLRDALGFQPLDVIVGVAGRAIKRERDVAEAIGGVRYLDATSIYVDVLRDGEPVLMKWKLDASLRSIQLGERDRIDSSTTQFGGASGGVAGGLIDPFDTTFDQITKLDEFHYALPRSLIDKVLANPMAISRGARAVPAMSMGKTEGIKLYAIRPTSLYAKLGFSNGDLIRSINGFALDGPDKALEIYTRLRDATSLEIELTRRGRDETLRIEIR